MDALMYEAFYGLRERPFDLTPNPRFLLLTGKHREAISNLQYGLGNRRGLTLLVGEAGTGKTTVARAVIQDLTNQGARIAYLSNPTLTRAEFYEFLAAAFDLPSAAATSKVMFLRELEQRLSEHLKANILTALVIDEVQALPDDLLEEVRLLANLESMTDKLLPIVLSGQPELADRLNRPSLRNLKQRVSLRCELAALDERETAEYIAGRIRIAGGNSVLVFTRPAVEAVFRCSGGIPRVISVICDNALITGFAADRRPVDKEIVGDVCRDFDLLPQTKAAPRPAAPAPQLPTATPARQPRGGSALGGGSSLEGKNMFEHFTIRRRFSLF